MERDLLLKAKSGEVSPLALLSARQDTPHEAQAHVQPERAGLGLPRVNEAAPASAGRSAGRACTARRAPHIAVIAAGGRASTMFRPWTSATFF